MAGLVLHLVNTQPMKPRSATPWGALFSAFVGLFYGLSPIDIIPDLIPLLGLVDDAAVVPLMLILAFFQYRMVQKRNLEAQKANVIIAPPVSTN